MNISIVTPSFRQGQFIERTLQSVADQRQALPAHVTLEHVVCDGGSTDDTVEILRNFEPRVRFVSEKDKGQTDAINKGISATSGAIIGWLNSDDVYYPGVVAKVYYFFNANPDVDVVYGQADHIDTFDHAFEAYPSEGWNFERVQEQCFLCQPAVFFRRRVVEQYGLLDASLTYCMDYEFWLRLGKAGVSFAYVQEKWAGSRLYADNKTLGARVLVHKEINDMFKKKFGSVPYQWLLNYAYALVESRVDRDKRPYWFVVTLFFAAIFASWHWNRRVLSTMKSSWIHWGKSLLRAKQSLTIDENP